MLEEYHRRLVGKCLRSACSKMIAKELTRETAGKSTAFWARSRQLGLAYVRLVIRDLAFDQRVLRRATAIAFLYAAGHRALVCVLGRKRDGR